MFSATRCNEFVVLRTINGKQFYLFPFPCLLGTHTHIYTLNLSYSVMFWKMIVATCNIFLNIFSYFWLWYKYSPFLLVPRPSRNFQYKKLGQLSSLPSGVWKGLISKKNKSHLSTLNFSHPLTLKNKSFLINLMFLSPYPPPPPTLLKSPWT